MRRVHKPAIIRTKGLTDDRAKTRAIYQYVGSQIHYTGIASALAATNPILQMRYLVTNLETVRTSTRYSRLCSARCGLQRPPH
jgi:hypothetical protein